MMAMACAAMVVSSCSKTTDIYGSENSEEKKTETYSSAFIKEFGTIASGHDWGFGSFKMVEVTEPEGSAEYQERIAKAGTRAVASEMTVHKVTYNSKDDVKKLDKATCYFYLRVDNNIVYQEMNGTQNNANNAYYPTENLNLGNGVLDKSFNYDNEGTLDVAKWTALGLIDDNNGLSFASVDQPIPVEIFDKMPSLEMMALHIPDAEKIKIAGSVEAFNSENYKIFWYVCKYQNSTRAIHVDGILVPKDQITVNVPEYKKRIIVEDLKGNINGTTQVNGSDFDFNDVVFDAVTWYREGKNHLKIIVRAAGGQLPIYVNGKEIHDGIGYMFNTSNPDYEFGKVLIEDMIISENAKTFDFNSIPVEIEINGQKITAGSNVGEAPEKIAVDLDYKWCTEKTKITDTYPKFSTYVVDKSVTGWWK